MAEKDDKKEELEIEAVGPGSEVDEEEVIHDAEDERESAALSEDQDRDSDERAGHSEGDQEDDDRSALRERRRAERRAKKEQTRRERRELSFLRQRNEQLERRQSEIDMRMTQNEVVAIDTRIQAIEGDIRKADEVYAEAISKGDGQAAAEAQAIRDQLRDGLQQYRAARGQRVQQAQQRMQQPANGNGGPDPKVREKAQEWLEENPWFDPELGDDDSAIAKAIEERLARERGVDAAKGDDYWDEYNRRLKKRLPHLFDRDDEDDREEREDDEDDRDSDHNRRQRETRERDEKPTRKSGPRLTSGGRERPLKKNEVYVSKERREAMELAGVWDDVETRNRYLKQYQKWDAEARRNRGR